MHPRGLIITLIGGVFGSTLALGWFGLHAARRAQAARNETARERAAVAAVLAQVRARMALCARDLSALPPASAPPPAAGENPAPFALSGLLAANPGLCALAVRVYRANLRLHYGHLYRALGLPPERIRSFEDLLTAHQEEMLDLAAAAGARGLMDSDAAVAGLRQQGEDRLRSAEIALLGIDGFRQLEQLARVEPVADIVTGVATTMALTDTPLSAGQAGDLTRFLADASRDYQGGARADPATIDWDRVLSQARGILSGPQYEALQSEYLKPQIEKMQQQFYQEEFEKK